MDTKNLDIYGSPPIPWTRARDQFEHREFHGGRGTYWLSTTNPDGHPHVAGVLGIWIGDTLYFASGTRTRKSRNLEANPHCAIAASLPDLDVAIEGTATRVTERHQPCCLCQSDYQPLVASADARAGRGK